MARRIMASWDSAGRAKMITPSEDPLARPPATARTSAGPALVSAVPQVTGLAGTRRSCTLRACPGLFLWGCLGQDGVNRGADVAFPGA
jgi:hypothetical protein